MMNDQEEELFREVLESFYLSMTKSSSIRYTLKNKMKKTFEKVRKDWELIPDIQTRSVRQKMPTSGPTEKQTLNEFASLRVTPSNKLSVSNSRSKLSKSGASSRDISQNDAKLFNCQWLYQSQSQSHTLLYGIMSAFILTDNKFAFKYFEDKVNSLIPDQNYSEIQLVIIGQNWQRMGDLLAQSKSLRWHKILKESISKFPADFAELTCRCVLGLPEGDFFKEDVMLKMSKELKIGVNFFVVTFREIDQNKSFEHGGKQIYIGVLTHLNRYVVSNKAPEYRKEELHLRALKNSFNDVISSMIETYKGNDAAYGEFSDLALQSKQKQALVREHFKSKMAET